MDLRTRAQWGASFDVTPIPLIDVPVRLVFIHHNVIEPTDDPNADMEQTEQVDIHRFGKPSYDWAVHPSGVVLEGMTRHLSPDTIGHNRDSHSIMFMGDFTTDTPTDAAMFAARELFQLLKVFGNITGDCEIYGHRDVYATACPGANLYPRIQEIHVPPSSLAKDELVLHFIHGGNQYMVLCGKIIYCNQPAPAGVVSWGQVNDGQYNVLTKAFGQPVT